MITQLDIGDDRYTLCSKEGVDTLSVNFREVYSFDKAGRFISALIDDVHYYRALDNRMTRAVERARRERGASVPMDRAPVPETEAQAVVRHVHDLIRRAQKDARFEPVVSRVLDFSCDRLAEDGRRFRKVYAMIPVLPPDRYRSLVLKVTEGCGYNRCTFCTLFEGVNFKLRSVDEFAQHVEAVKAYFGAGLSRWTSVFLGDANALAASQADLLAMLEIVHDEFPLQVQNGIYAFADGFASPVRHQVDLLQLSRRGLTRVYVGLETACEDLLTWVAKPNSPEDIGEMVEQLKSADIHVGVMVIVGLGGKEYAREHVAQTSDFINSLDLGPDDFVYLSPMIVEPHSPYDVLARKRGLEPLGPEEIEGQMEEFKLAIRRRPDGYPKAARYDLARFAY